MFSFPGSGSITTYSPQPMKKYHPAFKQIQSRANDTSEPIKTLQISEKSATAFQNFVHTLNLNPYKNYGEVRLRAGHALQNILTPAEKIPLKDLANEHLVSVLLKGVPVTLKGRTLPPTPHTHMKGHPPDKDFTSESFLLGLSYLTNAYPHPPSNKKAGEIIRQVVPLNIPLQPVTIAGTLSDRPTLSTANTHKLEPPDQLMFSCLRGDKNVKTFYTIADDFIKNLSKATILELMKPNFVFHGEPAPYKLQMYCGSILSKPEQGLFNIRMNTAPHRCEPLTPEALRALGALRYVLAGIRPLSLTLEQGDVLLLNNQKALHGQAYTKPGNPDEEIWLQCLPLTKKPDPDSWDSHTAERWK